MPITEERIWRAPVLCVCGYCTKMDIIAFFLWVFTALVQLWVSAWIGRLKDVFLTELQPTLEARQVCYS